MRLWSRPGHGSTFTIRLPVGAAPDGDDAISKKSKKKKKRAQKAAADRARNGELA